MDIKYPEMILQKSEGSTSSEKYLSKLCRRTFLSLWSFPNVYRDQGKSTSSTGKEICDLLVVFENHIIIFSDKDCEFPNSGNIYQDWSKWYRKAIKKSADQLWGAERWILNYPDRIYLDNSCKKKFPLQIPSSPNIKIHRIIIAHAASKQCIKQFGGGSGSLMLVPSIIGDMHTSSKDNNCMPFAVGQIEPKKGFIHIFDDTTLEIIMSTLDTVSDFTQYLERKEDFIASGKLLSAAGEEELLAHYLKYTDAHSNHDFIFEPHLTDITLGEGLWEDFKNSAQRKAQIEANKISYSWDKLTESFLYHLVNGTSYRLSHNSIAEQEKGLKILARENRTRRRMLGMAINEFLEKTLKDMRATRTLLPSRPGDPYYIFLLFPKRHGVNNDTYRNIRGDLLTQYCMITKLDYPEALDIVGIATETGFGQERSEDFIYLDAREWTEKENKEALEYKMELKEMGLLSKGNRSERRIKEYPDIEIPKVKLKGRERNKPCPCGSGRKYKKCCGQ